MVDPPTLLDIPEAPVCRGGDAEWFTGAGGVRLRAALFQPTGRSRGSIVISTGRTEAIEKYYELIGELQRRGFVVLIHDWRGQGLSQREPGDRLKGHANGARPYVDDFQKLLKTFAPRLPQPWVALGHSMGGLLTLLAIAEGENRFAGAILSAPMLGIRTAPTSLAAARWATSFNTLFGRRRRYMSRQAARFAPSAFEDNILTHDPVRYARWQAQLAAEPDLALGAPTWGWLDFALKTCASLAKPERLRRITIPVTIVSAEDERLVDNAAQAAAARHLPQGRLVVVPGAYHEILMERDPMRNIFMKALDALLGRAAPEPAKPPQPVAAAPKPAPAPTPAAAPTAAAPAPKPAAVKPAIKKPAAAKKPAAKKPAATKAAKAPAAKAAPAKKAPVAKKPAAKKTAVKKPAAKAAVAPKPAVAKAARTTKKAPVAKKPAAAKAAAKPAVKKAPAKKPAARKPAAKKA